MMGLEVRIIHWRTWKSQLSWKISLLLMRFVFLSDKSVTVGLRHRLRQLRISLNWVVAS